MYHVVSSSAVLASLTNITERYRSPSPSAIQVKIFGSVMLDLFIVAYAGFMTYVIVQLSLYWPFAVWKGSQEVEAPRFPDIWNM